MPLWSTRRKLVSVVSQRAHILILQDTLARTQLLQEVQRQLSEAKEQLAESRAANLTIQAERSQLEQSVQGSEASAELQMRLGLLRSQSLQLRSELQSERAEKQNWQAVCRQLQFVADTTTQVHPRRLDMESQGSLIPGDASGRPGSKLKQALIGDVGGLVAENPLPVGPHFGEFAAVATAARAESSPLEVLGQDCVETIPLLPPPKVISVVGDAEDLSLPASPHTGSPIASASTSVASRTARHAVDTSRDQLRKMRVHYLDASLGPPLPVAQREPDERVLKLVRDCVHSETIVKVPVNVSCGGTLEGEPLASPSVLPAPFTAEQVAMLNTANPWTASADVNVPHLQKEATAWRRLSACLA